MERYETSVQLPEGLLTATWVRDETPAGETVTFTTTLDGEPVTGEYARTLLDRERDRRVPPRTVPSDTSHGATPPAGRVAYLRFLDINGQPVGDRPVRAGAGDLIVLPSGTRSVEVSWDA